jgi:Holliday junction DNA helicase RuvA
MIGWLEGRIVRLFKGGVILNINGVGYKINTINSDFKEDQQCSFHIYHHIREDQSNLYGFLNIDELNLFELLLHASGVGPKLAMTILSKGGVGQVTNAISQGQPALLQAIPGVGSKVATKIVVELKNKLSSGEFDYGAISGRSEVIEAVMSLGMNQSQIIEALKNVPADVSTEEQIKQVLKQIGKNKSR